jgi:hypothetical protein
MDPLAIHPDDPPASAAATLPAEHRQLELQIRMLHQKIKLAWAAELTDLLQLQRQQLGLLSCLGGLSGMRGLRGPGASGGPWPPPHRNARERAIPDA